MSVNEVRGGRLWDSGSVEGTLMEKGKDSTSAGPRAAQNIALGEKLDRARPSHQLHSRPCLPTRSYGGAEAGRKRRRRYAPAPMPTYVYGALRPISARPGSHRHGSL